MRHTSLTALDELQRKDRPSKGDGDIIAQLSAAAGTTTNKPAGRPPESEKSSTRSSNTRARRKRGKDPKCKIQGCGVSVAHLKTLNVRYRICDNCCKANFVVDAGERKRFCQQCSRLQPIEEFDGSKRSCRDRLRRIGERRKDKMQLEEGHNKTRDVPVSSSWEHTSSLDAAQAIHEGSLQQDELSPLGRNTGAPSSMDVLISCQDSVSGHSNISPFLSNAHSGPEAVKQPKLFDQLLEMPESLTSGLPRVPSLRQGPGKFLSGRSFTVSGKKAATQTANRYGMETFGYNLLGVTPPSVAVGMRQGDFGGVGIPGDLSLQTQGMQGETQPRSCWMPTATNQAALLNHIQDPFQDSTLALPQTSAMDTPANANDVTLQDCLNAFLERDGEIPRHW